jgi:hypothetical protein
MPHVPLRPRELLFLADRLLATEVTKYSTAGRIHERLLETETREDTRFRELAWVREHFQNGWDAVSSILFKPLAIYFPAFCMADTVLK